MTQAAGSPSFWAFIGSLAVVVMYTATAYLCDELTGL